jgi:hypothetical protein
MSALSPLSRKDNTINAICCLSETKGSTSFYYYPPIEIGGYKYIVPNGTESLRNIKNSNSKFKLSRHCLDNSEIAFILRGLFLELKIKNLIINQLRKTINHQIMLLLLSNQCFHLLKSLKNDSIATLAFLLLAYFPQHPTADKL